MRQLDIKEVKSTSLHESNNYTRSQTTTTRSHSTSRRCYTSSIRQEVEEFRIQILKGIKESELPKRGASPAATDNNIVGRILSKEARNIGSPARPQERQPSRAQLQEPRSHTSSLRSTTVAATGLKQDQSILERTMLQKQHIQPWNSPQRSSNLRKASARTSPAETNEGVDAKHHLRLSPSAVNRTTPILAHNSKKMCTDSTHHQVLRATTSLRSTSKNQESSSRKDDNTSQGKGMLDNNQNMSSQLHVFMSKQDPSNKPITPSTQGKNSNCSTSFHTKTSRKMYQQYHPKKDPGHQIKEWIRLVPALKPQDQLQAATKIEIWAFSHVGLRRQHGLYSEPSRKNSDAIALSGTAAFLARSTKIQI
ncbi:hypothetical protein GCK72_001538 [Caenorhabditis remanei]|uniref:Uncharacterized protein n=1 Tax=Caenorhabditis remanei TaxID=31234 RepID=A0A6A5HR44_CAERE|nr:hypothetical protein GCK72_001538 [Caenorhabditis remanei]KAF1769721.1 hypothetical protein GCK72_001538 [Caenorhabditis remanei]